MQRLGKLKSCCRGYSTYSLLFSFHPPEIKQRQAQLYKHSLEDKKALKLAMKNSHLKTGTIHFFLLFVTPHSLILHTMTLNIKINVLSMLSALKINSCLFLLLLFFSACKWLLFSPVNALDALLLYRFSRILY